MITITQKEFKQLSDYIKSNYGIQLKESKMTLVTGRLQNVLQQAGFDNFTDYYNYVITDKSGRSVITLIDRITTNHTFFMRECDHFYYFKDTVLPYLMDTIKDKDLRIWCAACSSGEEAYTLAIIINEFYGKEKFFWDTKILATDISEQVLDIAKKGVYSKERIAPLPADWRKNYFVKYDEDNYILSDKIRNEVIYRKFNLMDKNFPFKKKFHTIFCRNVMIYFDNETKNKLIDKFYDQMEYGGYLFIGHSESLNKDTAGFKYIMPSVYRKL
jgi:chemotaxis protein methyltransferase CheR